MLDCIVSVLEGYVITMQIRQTTYVYNLQTAMVRPSLPDTERLPDPFSYFGADQVQFLTLAGTWCLVWSLRVDFRQYDNTSHTFVPMSGCAGDIVHLSATHTQLYSSDDVQFRWK
jgi:hypothetical protein